MCTRTYKTLVAGIGNKLMGDDGFGSHVIDLLKEEPLPDNVELRDYGTAGITIALDLGEYDSAIFIDAYKKGDPGEIYKTKLLVKEGFDEIRDLSSLSLHEVGIEGLLKFSKNIGTLPEEVILIGCVPKVLEPTLSLSPEVAEAAKKAVDMILEIMGKEKVESDKRVLNFGDV